LSEKAAQKQNNKEEKEILKEGRIAGGQAVSQLLKQKPAAEDQISFAAKVDAARAVSTLMQGSVQASPDSVDQDEAHHRHQEADQPEYEHLSDSELANICLGLKIHHNVVSVREVIITIANAFQRDLNPIKLEECKNGSLLNPNKELQTLCLVWVGLKETLISLNKRTWTFKTVKGKRIRTNVDTGHINFVKPAEADEHVELDTFIDHVYRAIHNKLVAMGGQHQVKGHRLADMVNDLVGMLRPYMNAVVYAISPVRCVWVICHSARTHRAIHYRTTRIFGS
jgi:hypothetical protein